MLTSPDGDGLWQPRITLRRGRPRTTRTPLAGWTQASLGGANAWVLDPADDTPLGPRWSVPDVATASDTVLAPAAIPALPPDARLVFRTRYDTENVYDGGVLELATPGGPWEDAGPRMLEGAYRSGLGGHLPPDLRSRNAWSGDSDGWRTVVVDVADLAGQTLAVRWRFATDASGADGGQWIDDAVLETTTWSCEPAGAAGEARDDAGAPGRSTQPLRHHP